MTERTRKRDFASRPGDAEGWIRAAEAQPNGRTSASAFTARLTVDITPELRGWIKVAAFRRGMTVADMLRDLLAREFPPTDGDQP
ncbi:MAG: hypothetical protein E5X53_09475 [Mesorhizobium sp.]|uniref:hypothetical protein n=1 Tax=Mesorhizobium sp. TaxID=1871066 RepID=UPI001223DF63|nr:hypothetical protein [Mesorhizobium sp.]TIR52759.1 MAG: hypothetical protein E5X53_09475 [Mesorhizobium sp.]